MWHLQDLILSAVPFTGPERGPEGIAIVFHSVRH